MYTIINTDYIGAKRGLETDKSLRVDIVCDTSADIPTPHEKWSMGSTVWIVDTSKLKVLNSEGEWLGK